MEKSSNITMSENEEEILNMVKLSHEKISKLLKKNEGLVNENNVNVKIFKSANDFSIMDVTASLNYHKTNQKKEDVYKGKIILSITDRKKSSYIKFFLGKAKAKVLMKSIMEHTFNENVFNGGFSDYGGTGNKDPNKIKARILRISLTERKQYKFSIYEGKGKEDEEKGSFMMVGEPIKTVERYVPYEEALEMAHEVYDYIRDQELKAVINGKPLYTLTGYEHPQKTKDAHDLVFMAETYFVQVEPWKGMEISSLSNHELKYILKKANGLVDKTAVELYERTVIEIRKRMNSTSAN